MSGLSRPRVLLTLLAAVSVLTTGLIVLAALKAGGPQPPPTDPGDGSPKVQTSGNPLFDQPWPAPSFDLLDTEGEPFTGQRLAGEVAVVDFIFTRCPGMCPAMTSQMYQLQERLREAGRLDDVRLMSISVDPEHDTPDVMKARAEMTLAEPGRWLFLTGRRAEIERLVREDFKLGLEEAEPDADVPIIHSGKFVLLDEAGRIRGYYDALEADGREALWRDLQRLLGESGAAAAADGAKGAQR